MLDSFLVFHQCLILAVTILLRSVVLAVVNVPRLHSLVLCAYLVPPELLALSDRQNVSPKTCMPRHLVQQCQALGNELLCWVNSLSVTSLCQGPLLTELRRGVLALWEQTAFRAMPLIMVRFSCRRQLIESHLIMRKKGLMPVKKGETPPVYISNIAGRMPLPPEFSVPIFVGGFFLSSGRSNNIQAVGTIASLSTRKHKR